MTQNRNRNRHIDEVSETFLGAQKIGFGVLPPFNFLASAPGKSGTSTRSEAKIPGKSGTSTRSEAKILDILEQVLGKIMFFHDFRGAEGAAERNRVLDPRRSGKFMDFGRLAAGFFVGKRFLLAP